MFISNEKIVFNLYCGRFHLITIQTIQLLPFNKIHLEFIHSF